MAGAQDETHASTSFKRQARKRKGLFGKTDCSRKRARVDIGVAVDRWQALKAAHGLKSDAKVALSLLDAMKKLPSLSDSSGPSDNKIKFSQSEVQTLIEQEVHATVKENEAKVQGLIETIKLLDHAVDYESSMQKLEARINTITKRAEAALSHMTKTEKKYPQPSHGTSRNIRSDSCDETIEQASQSKSQGTDKKSMDFIEKREEFVKMMETTRRAVKRMHSDKKALKAVIADLGEEPVPTSHEAPDFKGFVSLIKKEPEDFREIHNVVEKPKHFVEPKAVRVKEEPIIPRKSPIKHEHTDSKPATMLYPPLPPITFPSNFSIEAASYNIPQKLIVRVALIRKPPSLSVLWQEKEMDPCAPPMDSYKVFFTMEEVMGSSIFPDWTSIGEEEAADMPMCRMISKYKPGHKVCVAVVGKDKFGRYGPYSDVVTAAIPM